MHVVHYVLYLCVVYVSKIKSPHNTNIWLMFHTLILGQIAE